MDNLFILIAMLAGLTLVVAGVGEWILVRLARRESKRVVEQYNPWKKDYYVDSGNNIRRVQ
jgi:hypothetical protein